MYYSLWFGQNSCLCIIQNKVTQIKLNAWVMKMYVFSQNLIILVELKLTWSFQIEAGRRGCRGLCCRSVWVSDSLQVCWTGEGSRHMQLWEFDLKVSSNLKGKKEGRRPVFILTCKQSASHTHTKYTNVIVLSFSLVTSCFILKGSLPMCIIFYFLSLTLSAFL